MFKHILIPTDGSALSKKAVVNGVRFARDAGAKITGFFATPVYRAAIFEDFGPTNFMSRSQHRQAHANLAAKHLGVIEKACKAAGVPYRGLHVESEFPADAIIAAAKSKKCDL